MKMREITLHEAEFVTGGTRAGDIALGLAGGWAGGVTGFGIGMTIGGPIGGIIGGLGGFALGGLITIGASLAQR